MARRLVQIAPAVAAGGLAASLIGVFTLGTLAAVILRGEGAARLTPADWAAIRFTVVQAVLSAGISVSLAIPVARALARRQFPGRQLLIALMGAPFLLPVIVAVLGLLAVFGRAGIVNEALAFAGLPTVSIFGLHGVVLAHVFFNMPLAVRLLLRGWIEIPAERFRLAAALGFGSRDVRRHLEYPMLRATVPGALMIVFMVCLSSFAVALTLGGGPSATTVELAIYQAFRFEFDLSRASLLAIVQLVLTAAAALLALRVWKPAGFGAGQDRVVLRFDAGTPLARVGDLLVILVAALFLLAPLAMIFLDGILALTALPSPVWEAALRSLLVALVAASLAVLLALPLALAAALGGRMRWIETVGYLSIAASPLVLGTGLFLILFPIVDPVRLALPVTALVNALMALPFVLRAIAPTAAEIEVQYGRLADHLGLLGWARMRILILPRLRQPLAFGAAVAAALSMGDLGVIALFSDPDQTTLPLQVFRLMAAYRSDAASGAALLLLILSFGLYWIIDRGGRSHSDA